MKEKQDLQHTAKSKISLIFAYFNRFIYLSSTKAKFALYAILPGSKQKIVDQFHKLFYDSNVIGETWNNLRFMGVKIQKCPFDLFIYQEILNEVKPDVIIEAGTAFGGGAYYLASICDLMNKGKVITIDIINERQSPKHKRVTYLRGSSTSDKIVKEVKKQIKNKKVLVILDSDHSKEHVLNELKIYGDLVSRGSYMIVEDSNVNGHPVSPQHGAGPMEAIWEFLKTDKRFKIDKSREKLYLTFNPSGYLKRV